MSSVQMLKKYWDKKKIQLKNNINNRVLSYLRVFFISAGVIISDVQCIYNIG